MVERGMIIQPRDESWLRRQFHFYGSALAEIAPRLSVVFLIAVLVTVYHGMKVGGGLP
jgi:predicted membrane chloride channel (bestrophin family)